MDTVKAYLPEGLWHDAFTNKSLTGGTQVELDSPLGHVSVLYRGGSIIPLQQGRLTTAEVRMSPFNLVIALPRLVSPSLTAFTEDADRKYNTCSFSRIALDSQAIFEVVLLRKMQNQGFISLCTAQGEQ